MIERCDVVVAGGGPAGAAAAIALARAGKSVVVLERSHYDRERVGETLPPAARVPLTTLNAWHRLVQEGHLPSPATTAVWGGDGIDENHFICNPYGHGWHLDRRRFDRMLASIAGDCGVDVRLESRVTACVAGTSCSLVEYMTGAQVRKVQARFIIDATGRSSLLAHRYGANRIPFDNLIAIVGIFVQASPTWEGDYRTLVEAVADGWWYSARLPQSQVVVAYMTDADLIPRGSARIAACWRHRLRETAHTHQRVKGLTLRSPHRIVSARSELLDRNAGHNWLAIGDAAISFDPLSSQGIYYALTSGLLAAQAIERCLDGDSTAVAGVANWIRESFKRYWRMHLIHYSHVRRWPDALFWRRRFAGNEVQARVAKIRDDNTEGSNRAASRTSRIRSF